MTDEEVAQLLLVADQALTTAAQAHRMLAGEFERRLNTDEAPPAPVATDDPTTCGHPTVLSLPMGVDVCDSCGVNLINGVVQ